MQKQVLISIRHKARFTQVLTHPRLVDSKMLHRFPEIDEILSHTRKTSQPTTTSKNPKTLASVSGFVICSIFFYPCLHMLAVLRLRVETIPTALIPDTDAPQ